MVAAGHIWLSGSACCGAITLANKPIQADIDRARDPPERQRRRLASTSEISRQSPLRHARDARDNPHATGLGHSFFEPLSERSFIVVSHNRPILQKLACRH
jgi:hypothetical protein